ncbi:MAG: protein kinase [Anaerolineales bacterium]|nr:protein kinase [Anaerolineales bacterium]
MTLRPGELFAERYLSKLTRGAGSTGIVYQAQDQRLERLVALKMMHEELAQRPAFQRQFEQEAHLLARLSHPAIITLFDFNSEPQPHLVMPYYDDNLSDYLLKNGNNVYEIVEIGIQIGQALSYLHTTTGKIHGDVKPENILLKRLTTGQYQAVLTDFGLSQLQGAGMSGTPTYMSPEQCLQQETNGRSDIYSLGVVLYELFAKHPPFVAETPEAARQYHNAQTPLPSLARSRPDLPHELVGVIMTMLAFNAGERYEDALTAVNALRAAQPSSTFTPPPPQPALPLTDAPSSLPNLLPTGTHLSISQQLPRQIQLNKSQTPLVIGSNPKELGTHIVLRGAEVAPKHAELHFEANTWFVFPLDKEKPIYLNGDRIYDRVPWEEYKTLQIGTHFLRLNLAEETLESGRSFDVALNPSRLEIQPGSKQRVEVIIRNGSKLRGYYQIKTIPPPAAQTDPETIAPTDWLIIKHNGIPVIAGEHAILPLDIDVPADAVPGNYCFAVAGEALATDDGTVTAVGYFLVSQTADFAVKVSSTELLENQVCWVSIENEGNLPHDFMLTLSDMEQELLFGLVPEQQTPATLRTNGRSPSPTNGNSSYAIPTAQSVGGLRSLPFLRSFFDPLRQNWLSRLWRRASSQVRYVRGLGRYLPNAPRLTTEIDTDITTLPPAFFHPPRLYTRLEEVVAIAPHHTKRVGFVVEAKERPFTARYPQNHAFTLSVRAGADKEDSRAATVSIQPRHNFRAIAVLTALLIALPLVLWLLLVLANSDLRQLRAAAAALAAENLDGDENNSGAEVLLQTDPEQPPATQTPTPIPFTTPIAIALATPAPSPTATLPTQLFSVGSDDGYLVMSGKQVAVFADEPVLRVGDTATNGAARAIVSFNTSAITSDTDIRTVELFFWPDTPPEDQEPINVANVLQKLGSYLYADMAPGGFGSGRGLGLDDFSAQTDAIGLQIATMETAPNGVQVRLRFGEQQDAVIAALQQYDTVEFRLYFLLPSNENDIEEQYVLVSGDSEDEEKRPYLEITYGR